MPSRRVYFHLRCDFGWIPGRSSPQCCGAKDVILTIVAGHCLVVGVRLAVPSSFLSRDRTQRVRQAVPLQPGRQGCWPIVKG